MEEGRRRQAGRQGSSAYDTLVVCCRISELEEQQSSHDRQLSMMRVQVHYLEDENCNLQERFLFVVKQKQSLGRLLEEYQVDRQETQASHTSIYVANVTNSGT